MAMLTIAGKPKKKLDQIRADYETGESFWNKFIEDCKRLDLKRNWDQVLGEIRAERAIKSSLFSLDCALEKFEGNDELVNYLIDACPSLRDPSEETETFKEYLKEMELKYGSYEELVPEVESD